MTDEERRIIDQFIARVGGSPANTGSAFGSVPQTQPALPPVDRDADALIAQKFQQYPEARYRITQLAFVQEAALVEAQNRIQQLQYQNQQMQQQLQQAQQAPQQSSGGGFFSGLFGGGRQQQPPRPGPGAGPWGGQGGPQQGYYPPPPPPQYPPNYQPGMFQQRQGSGFLGSALTTAAGVAGGMLAANAITSMFSGGHSAAGLGAGAASPWAGAPADQQYIDNSSWDAGNAGAAGSGWDPNAAGAANQDYVDNGSWDTGGGGGGFDDGGSWDSGGGSDDTF
ncbi:MAG: DUF2076 family protein [Proteobacteria bacterium]|nr:DUF2076 family protein [Pseudomonadota bacterium]